jgi:type IV secretory pathway TrbF-like protein
MADFLHIFKRKWAEYHPIALDNSVYARSIRANNDRLDAYRTANRVIATVTIALIGIVIHDQSVINRLADNKPLEMLYVPVFADGSLGTPHDAKTSSEPGEEIVRAQVKTIVKTLRQVANDPILNRDTQRESYKLSAAEWETWLRNYWKKDGLTEPHMTRTVDAITVYKRTDQTWEIHWTEHTYFKYVETGPPRKATALVQLSKIPASTKQQALDNPSQYYLSGFQWNFEN